MDDVALPGFESYGEPVALPLPGGIVVRQAMPYPVNQRRITHGSCTDCIDITTEQAYGFRNDAPPFALPAVYRIRFTYWDRERSESRTLTRKVCRGHQLTREQILQPTTKET